MYLEYTVGYIEGSCSKCEVSMSNANNTASRQLTNVPGKGIWDSHGEVVDSPQTSREAVVVCYHHGRIEGLKVQNQDWICIEFRFRFQNQGKTLWSSHSAVQGQYW